jgi:hypothetical protein
MPTQTHLALSFLNGSNQGIRQVSMITKPTAQTTRASYLNPSKKAEPVIGLPCWP